MRATSVFSFAAMAALALTAACGGPLRYQVRGGAKAPEADGEIVADVNESAKMTKLHITVSHLAPPDRLQSDGKEFVVWTRHDSSATWTRVGALHYDADDRQGELVDASVPEIEFELVVTVEEDASPVSPSPNSVFSQEVHD